MCGIGGCWDPAAVFGSSAQALSTQIVAGLEHRGPDDDGHFDDEAAGFHFGMRRLSIVDIAHGHQPIFNEDGTVAVVFNGEIYNHRELRARLTQLGHVFNTDHSDTEVIVHAYEQWGERCFRELSGMFAIAIWDRDARRLTLARDPVGKKPLYVLRRGSAVCFASEAEPLAAATDTTSLSAAAVADVLHWGFADQGRAIWHKMSMLQPGTAVSFSSDGSVDEFRYWSAPDPGSAQSVRGGRESAFDVAVSETERLLDDAVAARLQADVPVGLFLSGGLDSSLLAALASERTGDRLQTFSVRFNDDREDESRWSSLVAEHFDCEHRTVDGDVVDEELLRTAIARLDEPLADAAAVPTFVLSRLAAQNLKVVISGEGADELFLGYEHYLLLWRFEPLLRLAALAPVAPPGRLRSRRLPYLASAAFGGRLPAAIAERFSPRELAMLGLNSTPGDDRANGSTVELAARDDFRRFLPRDLMMKIDKTTMANSLEARAPYLDRQLVEFVMALPPRLRIGGRLRAQPKALLKAVARRKLRRKLPAEIVDRQKHAFLTPTDRWMRAAPDATRAAGAALGRVGIEIPASALLTDRSGECGFALTRRQRWTLFVLGLWLDERPQARLAAGDV
ncbi:MAG: asparagine synthase (glutamine-hydrolyzing) [Actinobacteria bacterium]|nr:asparagine synthase (glutamine-hydrolyzing) [Actinomycetota bacterium]